MKAARYFSYGDPTVLQLVEVGEPETGDFDILVRVRATSITYRDVQQRAGKIKDPTLPLPFQLGREVSGEVASIGSKVTLFKPGDRVIAMTSPACGHCENCRRGDDYLRGFRCPPAAVTLSAVTLSISRDRRRRFCRLRRRLRSSS